MICGKGPRLWSSGHHTAQYGRIQVHPGESTQHPLLLRQQIQTDLLGDRWAQGSEEQHPRNVLSMGLLSRQKRTPVAVVESRWSHSVTQPGFGLLGSSDPTPLAARVAGTDVCTLSLEGTKAPSFLPFWFKLPAKGSVISQKYYQNLIRTLEGQAHTCPWVWPLRQEDRLDRL